MTITQSKLSFPLSNRPAQPVYIGSVNGDVDVFSGAHDFPQGVVPVGLVSRAVLRRGLRKFIFRVGHFTPARPVVLKIILHRGYDALRRALDCLKYESHSLPLHNPGRSPWVAIITFSDESWSISYFERVADFSIHNRLIESRVIRQRNWQT